MPQFTQHQFLARQQNDASLHNHVLALGVQYRDNWYHVGTGCIIASNLMVTAKHLLEFMYFKVAGRRLDLYDPDAQNSPNGHSFNLPEGLGMDAFQFFHERRSLRRFSVQGYFKVGYKDCDLLLLLIEPHPLCPYREEPQEFDVPFLDLFPPSVGRTVNGFGYPDHPERPESLLLQDFHSDYYLYHSTGVVEAINSEPRSALQASYQTSMGTISGMSGGPVFTKRDIGNVCCGIISRGGTHENPYSLVSPLWLLAGAQVPPVDNLPVRYGATSLLDVMRSNQIKTIGIEHLDLIADDEHAEWITVCDDNRLRVDGY